MAFFNTFLKRKDEVEHSFPAGHMCMVNFGSDYWKAALNSRPPGLGDLLLSAGRRSICISLIQYNPTRKNQLFRYRTKKADQLAEGARQAKSRLIAKVYDEDPRLRM